MEKRPALMKQLFAVARSLNLGKEDLYGVFRVTSLQLVPTRVIEAWIVSHNKPIPGEPHQGGKRKSRKGKRRYSARETFDYWFRVMLKETWPERWLLETLERDCNFVPNRPVNPRRALSKAISQMTELRINGWPSFGIPPLAQQPVVSASSRSSETPCSN